MINLIKRNHELMHEHDLNVSVSQPMMTKKEGTNEYRFLVEVESARTLKKFIIVTHNGEMVAQELAIHAGICAYIGKSVAAEVEKEEKKPEVEKPKTKAKKKTKKVTKKAEPVVIKYDRTNANHTQELLNYLNANFPNWSQDEDKKKAVSTFSKGDAKDITLYSDDGKIHGDFTDALTKVVA